MTISKAQIISSFNKLHVDNIEDILEVYGGICVQKGGSKRATTSFVTGPDSNSTQHNNSIYSAKLTGLEMDEMTISFKHSALEVDISKPIALDTPDSIKKCQSWDDVRETLVFMAIKAAEKRGVSEIVLRGVEYPNTLGNFLLIGLVMMVLYGHYNLDQLYNWFQSVPILKYLVIFKPYHHYLTYGTFISHIVEIWMFLIPRLAKYRISTDYTIEWYLLTLLDGYPTIRRLDQRVERFKKGTKYWNC